MSKSEDEIWPSIQDLRVDLHLGGRDSRNIYQISQK